MIESDQHASHTIPPPLQDPTLNPPTLHPTWLTSASAVAHTVRITHIPNHADIEETSVPETSGKYTNTGRNGDQDQLLQQNGISHELASAYYDAAAMAPLNPFSKAAINRLRAYKPPAFPLWDRLPIRMRAAVLILLYADRFGDLRVVITMRAASLRNFSGHAALPGGKADSLNETPYQIARREAFEEIGLPMDDHKLPKPFRVEKLCYLPPFLARTHVVVTPCVAYLHADAPAPGQTAPIVEHTLVPTLDAREVAAVFTAPFYNFLKSSDLPPQPGHSLPPGHWYDGSWINWKNVAWRVHNFYVPINNQHVSRPLNGSNDSSVDVSEEELKQDGDFEGRFKVWGMTGRVMVDAARIAYGEPPEVEHNPSLGDTDVIMIAEQDGQFREEAGKGPSRI